ncbi:MAG: tetratricopeptide repeat protein [Chloroflexi bacterium]|nr:tetratricopeptide repeat protein [Chloroflexota bacterium]
MVTLSPLGNEDLFRRSMNQGHSAAWEGRWQEAVEHYSRALAEFPDNAPTLNSLALAHLELGNLEQALDLYRRAARLSPEDPLPPEKTAQIYKQTGRIDEAVKYSMQAAELHLKLRDADKAINNWTRVIRLEPDHIDAHAKLALVYEKLGRTPQAITEYIAVAALQQHAGMQDEALRSGEHALNLNPKNKEAQEAVAMLQAHKPLPKPVRQGGVSGSLRLLAGKGKLTRKVPLPEFEAGPDPIEEATQRSLQILANMLFDLSPREPEPARKTASLRSIARAVSDGLLTRGFDETAILRHLSRTIALQTENKLKESAEELKAAIDAGLDHPAAHFNLGVLLSNEGRSESAQRSFQYAVKHADFALAANLLLGDHHLEQERYPEAVTEYLQALKIADSSVLPEDKAEALRAAYEPLIAATAQSTNENEIKLLCENIRHLLMRPNWRTGVNEARGQLPGTPNGAVPIPIADILTNANSGRLVDALARINQISHEGYLRTAMEEAYAALEFSPSYLPLHIHMGELLLMNDRPQQAIEKLSTVARVYSARGESDRATQTYERIVSISPLDVDARIHLIDQLTAAGHLEEAARQNLELADVYYRLAQLDEARDTYEKALHLAQGADVDASWNVQILHQMADIDLQRLDWRKALRVYEQLRTMAPNDEMARLKLIQLNLRLGQAAKANVELDNYLSSLNSRGREQDAGNFLRNLVDENQDYPLGHRRLAEHYQQNGQREDAIREWNKVGELFVESGDREGAKAAVRAILALNPPNAQRYQQFLNRLIK